MFRKLFKRKKKVNHNEDILAILDVLVADIEDVNRAVKPKWYSTE